MEFNLLGKAVRRFRLPVVDYINTPVIIVPVKEGDINSRYFEITLYDDRGDIDLSIYTKVRLSGETPSGVILTSAKCEISEDKKAVVVQFSGGFTARAGRVTCSVTFTNADNTVLLTSQKFYVIVSKSQSGKTIIENDENYNELMVLLKEIRDFENRLETAEADRVEEYNQLQEEWGETIKIINSAEQSAEEAKGLVKQAQTSLTNITNIVNNARVGCDYDEENEELTIRVLTDTEV